jgi:uncharacterized protein
VERDASQQPAANEAVTALQAEGYLQPCEVRTMQFYSPEMLRERVFNAIPQLTLELTERCNLRCHYCAFTYDNDRVSQCRAMGRETAVHAVDNFLAHSRQAATPTISFWGGEPLLGFRLMRAVIEYANGRAADRPLRYSFTTNATLVTPAIAAFLARNRVDLLVSLDGPRHVHDQNRRGKGDTATFDRVIAGLHHLKDADAEYYKTVRFNCVVARDTDLDELMQFFADEELTAGHHVSLLPASRAGLPNSPRTQRYGGLTPSQLARARTMFVESRQRRDRELNAAAELYAKQLQPVALRSRTVLGETIHPNGCCAPLLRKMLVRVNGDVHLCEQPPYKNCLGNVSTGLDLDQAVRLAMEYASRSVAECSRCWAMRLCGACYLDSMTDGRWHPVNRARECAVRRERIRDSLVQYAAVCEDNPSAFDYLEGTTFTFPV